MKIKTLILLATLVGFNSGNAMKFGFLNEPLSAPLSLGIGLFTMAGSLAISNEQIKQLRSNNALETDIKRAIDFTVMRGAIIMGVVSMCLLSNQRLSTSKMPINMSAFIDTICL